MKKLTTILVFTTLLFAFSACKKDEVSQPAAAPATTPPLTCDGLNGIWELSELYCNEVRVDLTAGGVLSFSVDFGPLGSTQAETNVVFANGCQLRMTWTKQGSANSWTAIPISENCSATCTNQQCDGTLPAAQTISCARNTPSKFNVTTPNAGICQGTATSREVYLKTP